MKFSNKEYQILSVGDSVEAILFGHPNQCPYCHKTIIPIFLDSCKNTATKIIYTYLLCPNSSCNIPFVAEYRNDKSIDYRFTNFLNPSCQREIFSQEIENVSPNFVKIYNQSYAAEQNELNEISGMGYRKSLEFLIKDYLSFKFPESVAKIINMTISNCVKTYIDDDRIKNTASLAIWLGNDQTHYEKKWLDKDLLDLKILIKLTVNWVESEILTSYYKANMNPE